MSKIITVLFFLIVVGCVTGGGTGSPVEFETENQPVVLKNFSSVEVVETCESENALFAVSVSILSDGSVICTADDIREGNGSYQGDTCIGPDPCDCTAVIGNLAWDFYWNPAGPARTECYPIDFPWKPCGCGTRFTFDPEDCVNE